MAREGVPLIVIQRQLGHSNLGVTSIYLQGIDSAEEIIDTVHARRAPMITLDASLHAGEPHSGSSSEAVADTAPPARCPWRSPFRAALRMWS
jgi:hypothetical protein